MEPLKGASWGSRGMAREEPGSVQAVMVGGAREACMSSTCWGVAAGGWYAQVGGVLLVAAVGGTIGKPPNERGRVCGGGPAMGGSGPGRLRLWLRAAAKLEITRAAASWAACWASRWTSSWESPAIVAGPAAARREAGGLGDDAGGHDMASGVCGSSAAVCGCVCGG